MRGLLIRLVLLLSFSMGLVARAGNSGTAAAQPESFYVDMGNPTSEAAFNLEGWGATEGPPQLSDG